MKKTIDKIIVFLMIGITAIAVYYVGFNTDSKKSISGTSGLTLQVGESYKIDTNNKSGEATYKSENEKVAKVDKETGNIVAVSEGKTKIIETINNEKVEYIVEVKKDAVKQIEVSKEETKDITEAVVTDIAEQLYTGDQVKPEIDVVLEEKELEENVDYKVSYKDNVEEGTSTVTVTGIGEYKGETTKTFEIEEKVEGEKPQAVITCFDKTYNGLAQKIASCSNGTINNYIHQKVGEYIVSCKGANGYSDAESKTCKINKIDLKDAKVDTIANQKYDGKEKKPQVIVRLGTTELKKDTEYKVGYINNVEEGTATVNIVAVKGTNYTGSTSTTFKIVKERSQSVITCLNNKYTGKEQVIAKCDGGTINQEDATHVLAGDYEVTCKGDTSHTDTKKTCKISKIDISNAKIDFTTKQKYTGSPITPAVTVTLNNKTLKKNEDYKVSHSNNTAKGTAAKVIITGTGNYSGTKVAAFTIAEEGKITCTNPTYTGVEQTIATATGCSKLNNAKQKNVGEYTVQCIGDSTHLTTEKKCVINQKVETKKETPDVVLNKTSIKLNAKGTSTITANQEVTYESKNTKVATVDKTGKVTGVGKGTTTIVVTSKDKTKKKEVSVEVIVPITKLTTKVKNIELILEAGKAKPSQQIEIVSIEPSNADKNDIKWSSSNTKVATIDAKGKLTAVGKGEAIIKASYGTNALATVIVKIDTRVTSVKTNPTSITLRLTNPKEATPKAEVTYSDGTKDSNVQWSSSNTKVVKVDQTGKITAVGEGTTAVVATSTKDKNVKSSITVTVEKTVKVQSTINIDASSPLKMVLGTGAKQLTATVTGPTKTVVWTSSNTNIAKVDQAGKVTAIKAGTVEITATISGTKIADKITVNIEKTVKSVTTSPSSITVNKGSESAKLAATVTYSDETKNNNVQWTSADKTIAEVITKTENGKTNVYVKGVKVGSTKVEAKAGGKTASIPVTVTAPKLTNISFSDAAIVLETAKSINKLTVNKIPSDAKDPEIEWSIISGKDSATIDTTGKITATKKAGKVIVQAKVKGTNITATKEITVKKYVSSVTIKQGTTVLSKKDIKLDDKITLVGVVTYTDGTTSNNVTWTKGGTTPTAIKTTVDSTTKAVTITGVSKGTLTLTATSSEKTKSNTAVKQTITINVSTKALTKITLPTGKIVEEKKSITLTPTYDPSTGIEKGVTWTSSNTKVATVDQNGKVTGVSKGTVTITATSKSNTKIKGTTTVTVQTAASVATKVTILDSNNKALTTSSTVTISLGNVATFKAKVEPSTASQTVTWASSNTSIAKVDSTGKVTAVKQGVVTITAKTNNNKSTSIKIKVSPSSVYSEYNSNTLKYWIEKKLEKEIKTYKEAKVYYKSVKMKYYVTHIWVENAYDQLNVELGPTNVDQKTRKKYLDKNNEDTRLLTVGGIANNIMSKNKNKGFVAINASPIIQNMSNFCPNCPIEWYGKSSVPLRIYKGEVVTEYYKGCNGNYSYSSCNKDGMEIVFGRRIYYLDSNSNLRFSSRLCDVSNTKLDCWYVIKKDSKGNIISKTKKTLDTVKQENEKIIQSIIKAKPRYTFGWKTQALVSTNSEGKTNVITDTTQAIYKDIGKRQGICQIDKNNFIIVTAVENGTTLGIAEVMYEYGCKTGLNLDGGGSVNFYWYNNSKLDKIISTNRRATEALYFIEK